jgi:hypothetical protein
MSRQQGLFPISGNFETRIAAPLDTRLVANTISNLTDIEYWKSGDNNVYLYKGLAVSVWNDIIDNNGIYILIDDDYTNFNNWLKVSGSGGLVKFDNTDTISFTQSGETYSAIINTDSITVSNLKTVDGGATASYLLSNDGLGNFKWVEPIPSEGSITMEDYNTGESFTNVQNIIIRGGAITVPGGTATGGLATTTGANTVTVWIPAPNYAPIFNPILNVTSSSRFVSRPTNNFDLGQNPGDFGIGDWNIQSNFTNNDTRFVTNVSNIIGAFSTPNFFNCYGPGADGVGTTMSFRVFDSNDNIVASIEDFEVSEFNTQNNNNLTITVTEFESDSDRKKAKITGNINISSLIPNGGRFYYTITHYNGEPGNEVLSFTSSQYFFDAPASQSGSGSTSNISGTVTFDENSVTTRYFSGVAYYTTGTTFGITVSGINLLNQITFPTDRQIQLTANNMLINSVSAPNINTMRGLGDGTKGPSSITGWSVDWNSTGLTFSSVASVNINNSSLPGFSPNTSNNISLTPSSNIRSDIYDYGISDTELSTSKLMLFDTLSLNSGSFNSNPIIGEGNRLLIGSLLSSGSLTFNSNVSLPGDELQYIFGRVIYPQQDFTQFYPSVNFGNSVNYSSLTGSNKTFDTYTNLNTGASSNVSINNYRWYVTNPFGVNSNYDIDFTNGIFSFNCNFTEDDLDYKPITNSTGNGDLVIMLGFNPGVNGDRPNKFIYLTGDINSYPGRSSASVYNLDGVTKNIQFTTGQVSGVRKVWLLIGYKNSTRGKSLILSNVQFG